MLGTGASAASGCSGTATSPTPTHTSTLTLPLTPCPNPDCKARAKLEQLERVQRAVPQGGTAGGATEHAAAAMYADGMAHARARLRNAPPVAEELDRWWHAAAASLELAGGGGAEPEKAGSEVALDKAEYTAISRRLFKALMPI